MKKNHWSALNHLINRQVIRCEQFKTDRNDLMPKSRHQSALQNFFWNTQMMSTIICYVFLAAESESEIRFASSRLDLAVPKLSIFAFLLKSEKNCERKWSKTITWMFFYVFLDEESEKSIRNTLSCLLFEFSLLSKTFFVENKKVSKTKKVNVFSKNKFKQISSYSWP